jgi:signal transduction histidine kinase
LYRHIYGDKSRFLQVIINFLSNSLKFSSQGSEIHLHLKLLGLQNLKNNDFNPKEGFVKTKISLDEKAE